jgi:SET domain-containing protein
MDSKKVIVKKTKKQGWGIFAKKDISQGEEIASFDGPIYSWRSKKWTEDLYDHAIQFAR